MGINIGYLEQKIKELKGLLEEAKSDGVTDSACNPIQVNIQPASITKSTVKVYDRCLSCEELGNDFIKIGNGYMCKKCYS